MTEAFRLGAPNRAHRDIIRDAWSSGGNRFELTAGTCWFRVIRGATAREAARRATEAFPSPLPARFTPLHEHGAIVPSAYAGNSVRVALWETILRDVRHAGLKLVPAHQTRDRYLLEVHLLQPCSLFDLTRPAISRLAQEGERPPELSAAWREAYPITRTWAQCILDSAPGCQGLRYESHQLSGICIVLFERGGSPLFELATSHGPVGSGNVRRTLIAEADEAGAAIDFDEDPVDEDPS